MIKWFVGIYVILLVIMAAVIIIAADVAKIAGG